MAEVLEKATALYDEGLVDSYNEGIARGETIGEARGVSKGEALKAVEIAFKLLAINTPPESIAELTGLSLDDVMELKTANK